MFYFESLNLCSWRKKFSWVGVGLVLNMVHVKMQISLWKVLESLFLNFKFKIERSWNLKVQDDRQLENPFLVLVESFSFWQIWMT